MRIQDLDSSVGSTDRLVVKLLGDTSNLTHSLSRFDAAKAQCRYDRDRQRLLAVIEASFGTAAPFNQLVLEVLNARVLGLKEASRHSRLNSWAGHKMMGQAASIKVNVDEQLQA